MNLAAILAEEIASLDDFSLCVVETGSIRSTDTALRDDDGWSTLWFAECQRVATLYSIDLDCRPANEILEAKNLRHRATFLEGHSVEMLKRLLSIGTKFDVAFLDSASDPALIYDEFLVSQALVKPGGLILIDDVKIPGKPHTGGVKGDLVVPFLDENRISYRLIERNGPKYSTGVLIYKL